MSEEQRFDSALTLLSRGDVELKGRMPWSSNATFLVTVTGGGRACDAIYKPARGERPLWDFPSGLYRREVAAYVLDAALGWGHVPETVERVEAPLGSGSLQRFVDADFEQHYFTLLEDPRHHHQLRRIAAFDLLANNADRKGGHCLLTPDGRIWAIDHGVCFAADPKLRTVMWDFAGERLPGDVRDDVARLDERGLPAALCDLLEPLEIDALRERVHLVARLERFPAPGPGRPYPWPLV